MADQLATLVDRRSETCLTGLKPADSMRGTLLKTLADPAVPPAGAIRVCYGVEQSAAKNVIENGHSLGNSGVFLGPAKAGVLLPAELVAHVQDRMNASVLAVTELQARAMELDSAAILMRLEAEAERSATFIRVSVCEVNARYRLWRLRSRIDELKGQLRDDQLLEVAGMLRRPLEGFTPTLERLAAEHAARMRYWERTSCNRYRKIVAAIAGLAEQLTREAALGARPPLNVEYPRLSRAVFNDALMASALLRAAPRDLADHLPDPDYGF